MICKSLPIDFKYTKLKYKRHIEFIFHLFVLGFFFLSLLYVLVSFFCLFKLLLSLINSFLFKYYQDNNTEHHKLPGSRGETGNKINQKNL